MFNTPLILTIEPLILVYGFLVGVFSVLTFQIVPAYIGSQIRPIIVLKDMGGEKPFYRDIGFLKIAVISFLIFGSILYLNLRSILLVAAIYGLIFLMFLFTVIARYILKLISKIPTFNIVSFKLALRSIERNHWTIATALLAIAIGLGSVGSVLTTGEGLKDFVEDTFSSFADFDIQINGVPDSKIDYMENRLLEIEEVKTIYRTTDAFLGFTVDITRINGMEASRYISFFTEDKREEAERRCSNVNLVGRNLEHNPMDSISFRIASGRLLDREDIGRDRIVVSTRCADIFDISVGDVITFQFNDYNFDMEIVGVYSPTFQEGGLLGIITSSETLDKIRRTSSNIGFNIVKINNVKIEDYFRFLPTSQAKKAEFFTNPNVNVIGLELENQYFEYHDTEGIIISTQLAEIFELNAGDILTLENNDDLKDFIVREIKEGPFNKESEIIVPYKALDGKFSEIYTYTLNIISKQGHSDILSKKTRAMFSPEYGVLDASEIVSLANRLIDQVVIPVTLLASFSLFVAIIVVSNTMYLTIMDRKREIGIMKAIGASNNKVLKNLSVENLIVGVIGGFLSLIILYFAFFGISQILQIGTIPISLTILGGIFMLSIVVTVLASIIPAYNTSKIRPLSVLRYE